MKKSYNGDFLQVAFEPLGGSGNSMRLKIKITTNGGQCLEAPNGEPVGDEAALVVVGEWEIAELLSAFKHYELTR